MPDLQAIIEIARQAGEKIMAIYAQDFAVYDKSDSSPLTEADLASHHCIIEGLKKLTPEIPILSEESSKSDIDDRMSWSCYWLIDPLDGTKEFIKKNGEFTVNIALIDNHKPVLGVVHVPAKGVTYYGECGQGAFKTEGGVTQPIKVKALPSEGETWQVVGSRSHQSDEFREFIDTLPNAEIVSMGSSLKLCLVAEGEADLYPRLGPTSEWDTAAAQAVVEAAGGLVLAFPSLEPMRYNTRSDTLLNPWFMVCAAVSEVWASGRTHQPKGAQYEFRDHDSQAQVVWNHTSVTPEVRAKQKNQHPRCIWFTGLSGSGKSTLANALEKALVEKGYHTMLLDGDNVRHGLCKDLGMSEADRTENIRRVGELAKLMTEAGLIVITAFISPFRADREAARALFDDGDFIEVYVEAPLEVCEQRDPKGLYERARKGEIRDFTGVDSPYQKPVIPEIIANTSKYDVISIIKNIYRAITSEY
ncbi:3'(2'),5'-bisphosphate nucleotidase [Marinobacterium lacunae]|uniref:Multifunctional fusion protein n=1 Tax=Marinobacterium lacunae TaxID=1232683 RepID=A0A081G0C3_9GAMM|nr:3'(2'),5'-bisphosphate nucleotidase [Marinobacterium lacunae]